MGSGASHDNNKVAGGFLDRVVEWAKASSFFRLLVVITLSVEVLTALLNVINERLWWSGSTAELYLIGVVDTFLVSVIALPLVLYIIQRLKRAEAGASDNSAYLDSILRSSTGMGIAATDAGFRVTLMNPAAEEMFGIRAADVIGKDIRGAHGGGLMDRGRFEEGVEAVGRDGRYSFSLVKGDDDARRYLDVKITGITGSGRMLGYVMMADDVTARINYDAALRESESKFRTVVEQSLVGVAIIQDGRYAYVNPRHAEILGYTQEEMYGFDSVMFAVHPDDLELVRENIRKRITGEVPSIRYRFRFIRKDGGVVHVEVHGTQSEYGGRPAVISTLLDVTDQIRAEEALRFSETKYRSLVEQAADALVVHDMEGRVLEVNQLTCSMSGYAREELIGMKVFEFERGVSPEVLLDIWQRMAPGEPVTAEGTWRCRDGKTMPVEVRLGLLDIGGVRQVQALVRDITERREAGERIRQLNEGLEAMVAERTAELRESEYRYRMLMEQASDGIGILGPDGRIISVNRRLCEISGYEAEDFGRLGVTDVFVNEDLGEILADIHLIRAGSQVVRERTGIRKDGSHVPVEISANMLEDGSIQAIVRDITERKRAEELLRQSEERLRYVVQNMPVMMNAFDEDWNIVVWNKECERVTGYTSEEVVGNPDIFTRFYPDESYRTMMVRDWISRGNNYRDWEWDIRCKDGSVKTVAWSNVSEDMPLPGWSAWGIGIDVTARKKAESTLRESEHSYRTLAENLPGIVYRVYLTDNNRMRFFNDFVEPITGYSASELAAGEVCSIDLLIVEDDRGAVIDSVRTAVREKRPFTVEYRINRKDGVVRYLQERGMPVMGQDGEPLYIDGVILDITELKLAQMDKDAALARLNEAQKMETVGTLAGGIAHDFNNLLTVIKGEAGIAMTLCGESSPAYPCMMQVENAAERATDLTRKLLMFSRSRHVTPVELEINETVKQMVSILRRLIGEDIEIVTNLSPELWHAWAESSGIEQVVMNLALNARDAMPEGGRLTISTANVELDEEAASRMTGARAGRFVRLSVADTGHGMDAETINHIFDPFFTKTTSRMGTGLGLSVVYGAVKGVGGWVSVESAPGRGARFDVYLERTEKKARTKKAQNSELVKPVGTGERVLLVEDEEQVREFAYRALVAGGYDVVVAANAAQALDLFNESGGRFDIVFTDVVLPDMSGVQLVDEMLAVNPGQKLLLSSGYTGKKAQWSSIKERGFRFLEKPYVMSDLLRAIREALEAEPEGTGQV